VPAEPVAELVRLLVRRMAPVHPGEPPGLDLGDPRPLVDAWPDGSSWTPRTDSGDARHRLRIAPGEDLRKSRRALCQYPASVAAVEAMTEVATTAACCRRPPRPRRARARPRSEARRARTVARGRRPRPDRRSRPSEARRAGAGTTRGATRRR